MFIGVTDTTTLTLVWAVAELIQDMFIGATDTTTSTLVWTVALIQKPVALTNAQYEVGELIKGKGKVEETDLPQLVYLKSVIKEGLQLHPPLPLQFPRQTTESCTIGYYHIPAKQWCLFMKK